MSDGASTSWIRLPDETATLECARRLAGCLPRIAEPMVVYLQGTLGAGKTALARGMLRALGEQGPVRSPTYGLVAEYPTAEGPVLHLDLYRLQGSDELLALGLADYLPGSRLWLIEWPERASGQGLPAPDVTFLLEPDGSARRLKLVAHSSHGNHWLGAFSAEASS